MASQPKDDQMPKLSLEELADFVADLQDLSDVNGSDLRKFNHTEYDRREQYGAFYRDFYRQLQISPDHHFKFWDGILRLARRKHLDDIKRGTPASIKNLTDLVLRGFGYIIWAETSVWLLPFDQLEDGEQPLVYLRKGGPESSANARLSSILTQLWRRMRNLIFERKPPPKKRGRHVRPASPALTIDTESDIAHQGDTDTHALPSPALTYYPTDTGLRARVMSTRLSYETQGRRKMLTMRQADDAILDLIDRLAEIRAHTDPRVFEYCWDRRIGRLKELDRFYGTGEGKQETKTPTMEIPEPRSVAPDSPTLSKALSSEPFVSAGNPVQPQMPLSCLVPPTPPTHMSIWISTCGVISTSSLFSVPLVTASAIYSTHSSGGSTSAVSSPAYYWPNAPVQTSDLAPFFHGMNSRVNPPTSTILGWIFSYGWNDSCRFISSGLTELCNNTNGNASDQDSQCGDAAAPLPSTHAQEAANELETEMDIDDTPTANMDTNLPQQSSLLSPTSTPSFPPSDPTTTTPAAMPTAVAKLNADFDEEQWANIKLGWRDFQDDLREAARMGVKVWRMKVCVLNLTQ